MRNKIPNMVFAGGCQGKKEAKIYRKFLNLGCYELWFWERLCKLFGRDDFVEHQMQVQKSGGKF